MSDAEKTKFSSWIAQEFRRLARMIDDGELVPHCLEIEKVSDAEDYVLKFRFYVAQDED